jgi:hypothetical protein
MSYTSWLLIAADTAAMIYAVWIVWTICRPETRDDPTSHTDTTRPGQMSPPAGPVSSYINQLYPEPSRADLDDLDDIDTIIDRWKADL